MSNYDLRVLNDKEFEVLVADLLSEEFQTRIERFKAGRDLGVDGRWFATKVKEVIIQCKHWPRSNIDTLLSKLKTVEKPKVDRLKPARYIFVCSLELSRKNKSDIEAILKPHIKLASDVLGLEDIQDLLRKHAQVEKRNPKLWLASASVIGAILNSGIITRSADMLADITARLALYVDTTEAQRAREKLQRQRVLVIKGEPGVGKTTLAEQLVTESVAEGYQLSIIERDIREAESIFEPNQLQVFYFDDFLGRNFLEALDANKDSHITNFIKRIVLHQNKRFVLTTRTHILDRGKQLSEIFDRERIGAREFELTVGAYSRLEKGKILYSHLWNGSLPEWAIEEFYNQRRYINVIDHKNFNPRIIGFLTSSDRLLAVAPSDFWNFVKSNLDFPEAIWRHVFDQQLSPDTRDLALLVTFNGQSIEQNDLEDAFLRLNSKRSENPVQQRVNFSLALQLGVGSVLNRTIEIGKTPIISLFNPSIADYLLGNEESEHLVANLFEALRTKAALAYLEALLREELITEKIFHSAIRGLASALAAVFFLESPALLNAAGVINQADRVTLRALARDGSAHEVELTAEPPDSSAPRAYSDEYLSPERIEGETADWKSFLHADAKLPTFLLDYHAPFHTDFDATGRIYYAQFRSNADEPGYPIGPFVERVRREIEADQPQFIVLDLRLDQGGDFTKTASLMASLPSLTKSIVHVYVLTSAWTFSAGDVSLALVKEHGDDRVTLVGASPGDRLRLWAEGDSMVLPNSKLSIGYATGLHDYSQPCTGQPGCFWIMYFYPMHVASFEPDVKVPYTFDDYANLRDPLMDKTLKLIVADTPP